MGRHYFLRKDHHEGIISNLALSDDSNELGFMNIYTAAYFGHKHARAYLASYLENGIFPNR